MTIASRQKNCAAPVEQFNNTQGERDITRTMSGSVSRENDEALTLARQGKYLEAIACYDRALAVNPKNDLLLNSKTIALITVGRYEEALLVSAKAASVNPECSDIWINRAVAFEKLGRYPEARESLERATAINPYDPYAYALLGIVYQKMDHEDLAMEQNRKLQELMFPNEYAGFFFGTAAFLLGLLLGGVHSVEGRPFEIVVPAQLIILLFFGIICILYWKSLRQQQEIHRKVIVVPYPAPVPGDRSTRGMYFVLSLMVIVFVLGMLFGSNVWTWMQLTPPL
ncbi:MAG: tetratricopeptide repeat protein [Methanomicrobiales archaeon]|nr:tetratricopeptide repeat protein [Methanomicrobiales archaeon]